MVEYSIAFLYRLAHERLIRQRCNAFRLQEVQKYFYIDKTPNRWPGTKVAVPW